MGLTKRERILLFAAAVIVLTFLSISFVIMPMYENYTELSEKYDILVMEKMQTEVKIMNAPAIATNYSRAEERFNEINSDYPVDIPNEEIASILTAICQASGFNSILSLAVSSQRTYPDENIDAFYIVRVSMSLSGQYDSLKNLIDILEEKDNIRISQLSFSVQQLTTGSAASPNISVTFEMTILNKIDIAALLDEEQNRDLY